MDYLNDHEIFLSGMIIFCPFAKIFVLNPHCALIIDTRLKATRERYFRAFVIKKSC